MSSPRTTANDQAKRAALADASRRADRYLVDGDVPVFPNSEALERLASVAAELPAEPRPAAETIALLDRMVGPATVRSGRGRYFGFVTGGSEPEALAANVLASTWDQNAALPVMSPAAAHIDEIAARWIVELLGLPSAALGGFCGGAAVANLTCVIAARDTLLARDGWDVDELGLNGAPPIQVVASAEIHVAAKKALRLAGLGPGSATYVETDDAGRLRPSELPTLGPRSLVLTQAGNVNTGHSDPFDEIADRMAEAGGWLHVDGAFGLWAAASSRAEQVAGVDRADSWAVDAHKWLNVPYDSAVAICARGEDLRRAMAVDAAYLPAEAERASMHLGLQMSQRARAFEAWAVMSTKGRAGIAEMIDRTCDLAERMAARLQAGGAELLAPVALNQILVAFGDAETTDAVIAAVQEDRRCWAGGTIWKDRTAMRISLSDTSVVEADIDAAADVILECWKR